MNLVAEVISEARNRKDRSQHVVIGLHRYGNVSYLVSIKAMGVPDPKESLTIVRSIEEPRRIAVRDDAWVRYVTSCDLILSRHYPSCTSVNNSTTSMTCETPQSSW